MTFEQARNRLEEIKILLEAWDDLTLMQIQDLQKESEEIYEVCKKMLKHVSE